MAAEARRRGAGHVRQLTILGDGAHWIWNQASQHFPEATQIVDLYHAREHLHDRSGAVRTTRPPRPGQVTGQSPTVLSHTPRTATPTEMSLPSPNITMQLEPRPSLYTGFRTLPSGRPSARLSPPPAADDRAAPAGASGA